MTKLSLSVALSPYEHALDLLSGRIEAEGVDINWLRVPTVLSSERFVDRREFDVAELDLADYVARVARGDRSVVAISVFLSRQFVHGAIWVRDGGAVRTIDDLRTARVACDDETIAVYARHWLGSVGDSQWRNIRTAPLHDALAGGGIDAGLTWHRPPADKGAAIRRLFPDVSEAERRYYESARIFPILRVLCIQRDLIERHRWLAASLFEGFDRAKRNSLGRLIGAGMSRYPLPWLNAYVTQARNLFGDDIWPYGIASNRATLEAFLASWRGADNKSASLAVEDLFDEATRGL